MPGSRTKIYYSDSTGVFPLGGFINSGTKSARYRLFILPADDLELLASEVTFVALDKGIILEKSETDAKFDGAVTIGMSLTEELTAKVNYTLLPSDLQDWITNGNAGVTTLANGTKFGISSVWILASDEGDPSLAVSAWPWIFVGVHRHLDSQEYVGPQKGYVEINLKLQHIGAAVLEALSIDAFREYIFSTITIGGLTKYPYQFEVLFENSGCVFGWGLFPPDANHRIWCMTLKNFIDHIALAAQSLLQRFARSYGTLSWIPLAGCSLTFGGQPFKDGRAVRLYKQEIATNSSQINYPAGALDLDNDALVCLLISDVVSPVDVSSTSPHWIGGLLGGSKYIDSSGNTVILGRDNDSIFALQNLYDLLKDLSANSFVKTIIRTDLGSKLTGWGGGPGLFLVMYSAYVLDNPISLGVFDSVTLADFQKGWKWTPGLEDIGAANAQIPGTAGSDTTSVSFSLDNLKSEKSHTIPAVLTNAPMIGADVSNLDIFKNGGFSVNLPDFNIKSVICKPDPDIGFCTRGIYYNVPTGGRVNNNILVKASSISAIAFNNAGTAYVGGHHGAAPDAEVFTYPIPSSGWVGNPFSNLAYYNSELYLPLAAIMLDMQRHVNLPLLCCQAAVKIFGRNPTYLTAFNDCNPYGSTVFEGVYNGIIPTFRIGNVFSLDFSSGTSGIALFDRTPSQLFAILYECKPDFAKGTTACKFVALSSDMF